MRRRLGNEKEEEWIVEWITRREGLVLVSPCRDQLKLSGETESSSPRGGMKYSPFGFNGAHAKRARKMGKFFKNS